MRNDENNNNNMESLQCSPCSSNGGGVTGTLVLAAEQTGLSEPLQIKKQKSENKSDSTTTNREKASQSKKGS